MTSSSHFSTRRENATNPLFSLNSPKSKQTPQADLLISSNEELLGVIRQVSSTKIRVGTSRPLDSRCFVAHRYELTSYLYQRSRKEKVGGLFCCTSQRSGDVSVPKIKRQKALVIKRYFAAHRKPEEICPYQRPSN